MTYLVTGGTGSFGHAVVKRLLADGHTVRVFSRGEKKQEDMRRLYPQVEFCIGDVRDSDAVEDAMRGIHYVFHAAALKQVPACENYPLEAFKTNVLGAENVMRAAREHCVKKCVLLSTDKAVYPANAMGISKAMMEKLMAAWARKSFTVFCATRYGNVMGSRGSVIPLFLEQIKAGAPLTVTDPSMTRFLMTLESSVDLVLFAFARGTHGDIFVQKAPAAKTGDIAAAMGGPGYPIRVIGARPGEKAYELLVSPEEMGRAVDMGTYYRIPIDAGGGSRAREGYTSDNTAQLTGEALRAMLGVTTREEEIRQHYMTYGVDN